MRRASFENVQVNVICVYCGTEHHEPLGWLHRHARRLKHPARVYAAPVRFTNVTNGQGSTSRSAKLTVQRSATPSQRYLLDEGGGNLRDNRGEQLIAR